MPQVQDTLPLQDRPHHQPQSPPPPGLELLVTQRELVDQPRRSWLTDTIRRMVIAPASGPNWTDVLTALGTVGAVIVAVGIALWTEYRSDRRIREERARSDRLLAEQRHLEKTALEEERAHGRAQLDEERRLAREREQLAQAYSVQVHLAQIPANQVADPADGHLLSARQLLAGIVNRSTYTITRVQIQFCLGRRLIPHLGIQQLPSPNTPDALRTGPWPSPDPAMLAILTPFDGGFVCETEAIAERDLAAPFAMVRWTDHWGTRWEHKRGVVRPIRDDDQWEP